MTVCPEPAGNEQVDGPGSTVHAVMIEAVGHCPHCGETDEPS